MHCPDEPAPSAAKTSRAEKEQDGAQFAVSASHMQRGNLTALAQTDENTPLTSHTERVHFSLVHSCNDHVEVGTSYDVEEAGQE